MRKIAVVLPFPIVLALYACAAGTDGELDDPPVLSSNDASDDAVTKPSKDSGPASPPKDSGTSSSSGDAGREAGPGSSSGGSSSGGSSSGGSGQAAPQCSSGLKAFLIGIDLLSGGSSFANPVDSCNDCDPGDGLNCCFKQSGQDFCVDIAGAAGGLP